MLRLLIYGVPGTPVFELGERLAEFHRLEYYTIEKIPMNHESYFDDKIPEVPFDTGDFTSGSESQHMVRDPRTLAIDKDLEQAKANIPDPGPYEDCLETDERELVFNIEQGIVTTEIPDRALVAWASHVIFLYTDERKVMRWFAKRLVCPSCRTVFHLEEKVPVTKGKCDRCGSVLERQEQDDPNNLFSQFKAWRNAFWKFDEKSREGRFKMLNVDELRSFNDMVSRADLWFRDAVIHKDQWYSTVAG